MVMRFLFVLLALLPFTSYSQEDPTEEEIRLIAENESEQRLAVKSYVLMQEGYSFFAEIITDKLLQFQPDNANYNYRKGFLVLDGRKDAAEAKPFLEKAATKVTKTPDFYSTKETAAPPDVYYYLGRVYHLMTKIDKAQEYYQKFLVNSDPNSELIPYARLKLRQCDVAVREMATPRSARVENIGKQVNGKYPDYSSVISLDGSALYFTSRRPWENNESGGFRDYRYNHFTEDVYVSYMDFDGEWMEPFRLEFCIPSRNEATIAVSPDERRIYVYEDTTGDGDIYYSNFETNRFQEVVKFENDNVNTEWWEPHIYVTPDGQTMFFSSDRPGGFGGRDIYRCVKLPNQEWSQPINLGPDVNTPFDEDSPFMAIDNKTLYFASNGPLSMGDFDIFLSRRDADNNWSPPINLGFPLNSTNDDIYYTTTTDGLRGFLTSYRDGGYGEKDIYEVKNDYLGVNAVAVLKGQIKTVNDLPIPEDVAIEITCLDCDQNAKNTVYPRLRDGIYFSSMESCHKYELVYVYDNGQKVIYTEEVQTSCSDRYDEIYRDILIDVSQPDEIVSLPKEGVATKDSIVSRPRDVSEIEKEREKKGKLTRKERKERKEKEKELQFDEFSAKDFKNPYYKHYFNYNKAKINPNRGEFKKFVKKIEEQLELGRENISINIYASASHVPTQTFESNEQLAFVRAESIKYDIIAYFQNKTEYQDRIVVTIQQSIVSGPEYEKDFYNRFKYRPYQYVEVTTE